MAALVGLAAINTLGYNSLGIGLEESVRAGIIAFATHAQIPL